MLQALAGKRARYLSTIRESVKATIDTGQSGTHSLKAVCAAFGHQADHRYGDTVVFAKLLQCLSASGGLVAESEALSHHHARDLMLWGWMSCAGSRAAVM